MKLKLKDTAPVRNLRAGTPFLWCNPNLKKTNSVLPGLSLRMDDLRNAQARQHRFAPLMAELFPELGIAGGLIESELLPAGKLAEILDYPGTLLLKADNDLPIAGSIKARGGIYEVLHFAEKLAVDAGLLQYSDNYIKLLVPAARKLFRKYTVSVGSTGNLGFSIGMISAALGFECCIHMSNDAKQWKKERLRKRGVTVIEHESDYTSAVAEARKAAEADPSIYFVDDENSVNLFLGYATAAFRLKAQLESQGIRVDEKHPLFVYLPCGVGGAPGGITFGLKTLFGDAVHCFIVEPVQSPCMTLGLVTGKHSEISVYDIGLTNATEADGLAVSRPSGFVGKFIGNLLNGAVTLEDETLYRLLWLLNRHESVKVEPSAAAGIAGPEFLLHSKEGKAYLEKARIKPENITHIAWLTGGRFVPETEMQKFLRKGASAVKTHGG